MPHPGRPLKLEDPKTIIYGPPQLKREFLKRTAQIVFGTSIVGSIISSCTGTTVRGNSLEETVNSDHYAKLTQYWDRVYGPRIQDYSKYGGPGNYEGHMRGGATPGVDYDVPGVGYFTHLVISAKLPDDVVYKITKSIVKDLPRLGDVVKEMKGVTPKDLALDIGVPFHPGSPPIDADLIGLRGKNSKLRSVMYWMIPVSALISICGSR
jgi:hypothetical protein